MRDVAKAYGRRHVLTGFDADLARGSLVALEGRSGSGKTTILHLLAGLERADSGSIEVAGRDLGDLDREELAALRRAHIGWVGQEPGLLPFATALENCVLALEVRDGGRRPEHEPEARAWLVRLGLEDCVDRVADRLSAGERQRVAIARAVAGQPGLVLADEPTGNLDSAAGQQVIALLAGLAADGTAVVIVTHDPAVAAAMDRRVVMRDGRIVADGRVTR
jgi:putative ABC transport system ATP-binding protein